MYVNGVAKKPVEKHVLITPPPAHLTVPKDVSRYGEQKSELSDKEHIRMLQSALQDAQGEISLLRHHIRVFASILEVLVLMSKQGKPLRVVDEDGSIFVPRLEMEQRKALGGSVSVDRHPGGHIVRFRERTVVPIGDVLYG